MQLKRIGNAIEVSTPCKINPFLKVVRKRPDGYHDLDTIMIAVSLCDHLRFEVSDSLDHRIVATSRAAHISRQLQTQGIDGAGTHKNIIYKAIARLATELGITKKVNVTLEKSIPMQAGLGGGSSDAAATLVAVQLLWTGHCDLQLATCIAAELGSDVNFFLEGQLPVGKTKGRQKLHWAAHCTLRGERVDPLAMQLNSAWLIVSPAIECSTSEIFQQLNFGNLTTGSERNSLKLVDAMREGNFTTFEQNLYNQLAEVALQLRPSLKRLADNLSAHSIAKNYFMSGSGAALIVPLNASTDSTSAAKFLMQQLQCPVYSAVTWQTSPLHEQIELMAR